MKQMMRYGKAACEIWQSGPQDTTKWFARCGKTACEFRRNSRCVSVKQPSCFAASDDATRCMGCCSALHHPSQRAASAVAMRCVGRCTALPLAGVLPAVCWSFAFLDGFAPLGRADDGAVQSPALARKPLGRLPSLGSMPETNREEAPCLDASSRFLFVCEQVTALWPLCLYAPSTAL